MKLKNIIYLLLAGFSIPVLSQITPAKVTDSNTALHAVQTKVNEQGQVEGT